MPRRLRNGRLNEYLCRVASDAIAEYQHHHRLGPNHPAEMSEYKVPTTYLPVEIADQLARADDGSRYFGEVYVQVVFDVIEWNLNWRLEIALLTAHTPTPERAYQRNRRELAIVEGDKPDVDAVWTHNSILAFGQTLPALLRRLATGQLS